MSRGWAKASACRLQITLSCAVLCHIVSLQHLSGLLFRIFLSYGLQVVPHEVHWLSLRRLICHAQDHFICLTVYIISMTFVLSLNQMLVLLSLYISHQSRLLHLPYQHAFLPSLVLSLLRPLLSSINYISLISITFTFSCTYVVNSRSPILPLWFSNSL